MYPPSLHSWEILLMKKRKTGFFGSTDTIDLMIYFSGDHRERVKITLASHLDMDELTLYEREIRVDKYISENMKRARM